VQTGSYWDCSGGVCGNTQFCTNFACSPLFSGTSFRLATGSPAIDKGNNLANLSTEEVTLDRFDLDQDDDTAEIIPWDLDGRPRVQTLVDRGCYETD
jgi:hypothetical protein